jgi:glycosyltransferase involved in cell wall biosynthesis
MAVYNGEPFLAEAIESIQAQTFGDWELVAVDDGSTDSSRAVLERFAAADRRIRVFANGDNQGVTATWNRCALEAHAEYIAYASTDDVSLRERLAREVEFLDANPSVAVVGTAAILIDETGKRLSVTRTPTSSDAIRSTLLRHNCVNHPSVMIRRTVLNELGGFRFDHVEDYDLWLRISMRYPLANLPEPLVLYRIHPSQVSVRALDEQARRVVAVRAAARRFRSTGTDPLAGVKDLTPKCLEKLHLDSHELARAQLTERVFWASLLTEIGREDEAEELVAEAAEGAQISSRHVRACYEAARHLHRAAALYADARRATSFREILAALRSEPRFTSERIASELRDRLTGLHRLELQRETLAVLRRRDVRGVTRS